MATNEKSLKEQIKEEKRRLKLKKVELKGKITEIIHLKKDKSNNVDQAKSKVKPVAKGSPSKKLIKQKPKEDKNNSRNKNSVVVKSIYGNKSRNKKLLKNLTARQMVRIEKQFKVIEEHVKEKALDYDVDDKKKYYMDSRNSRFFSAFYPLVGLVLMALIIIFITLYNLYI